MPQPTEPIRIYLDLPPRMAPERGALYQGRLGSLGGEVLVTGTPQPFLDACRVLQARGLTGPVELWDAVRPYPRMRSTIEEATRWTVEEGRTVSPKLRKYKPFGDVSSPLRRNVSGGG